ncbi:MULTISPECIES: membrane protein insertase YidC [unclassified Paracoccus (in: a-proteobacteria)]|uniref:membrane protein insertase YidC n=1 Tax=unclassified Paracoccus (in: a-proteobacteria) TaxID=2688777 RepID=UPI0012B1A386|nr:MULTISPECIES: membrane protein insertase YidC [unclassified Paracoccus (in: a-proteobacteria)]UXU73731.1 membrane protein insertase YidC [Paracoccus sp. SMMA_5]UXU79621.1 membrane protein insertase YidC [Paracoccus sp. SMMA_5_TC]
MQDNNRNLILAMVLSALVMLVWSIFFAPEPVPPAQEPAQVAQGQPQTGSPAAPPVSADSPVPGAVTQAPDQGAANADPSASAGRVKIASPSLAGSISLAGGRIDDLELTGYHETLDPNSPYVRLLTPTAQTAIKAEGSPVAPGGDLTVTVQKPYYAVYGWTPAAGTDPALVPGPATVWQVESGDVLAPGQPVTLRWDNGAGQIFRRTYELDDKFLFTVTQTLENTATTPFSAAPYGILARHGRPDTQNFFVLHEGVVGMTDGKLLEEKYKNLVDLDVVAGEGPAKVIDVTANGWLGFTDKYWMTTLAPAPGSPFTAVVRYAPGADIYQAETRLPMQTVAPGATASSASYLFAGAKVWEVINGYQENPGIDRFVDSIDWGWFYFLTKPIFRLLHWLHGMIGNMGWAIIALTFVLKLLVFPLARKSYVSMAKMKELQPEMEAIKERTGDDRMKFQKEVMELYKREKVNPAAGCLPVLLQIPIFFALYKVIFVTIELRHAPWIGWIRDLAAPDPTSLWNLFGLLPWAAPGQGTFLHSFTLPVLAIVLGISMWMQQKLNPAPADPAQKMIFAWMPWIFMFMLGGFASGLVLYWITNNTITIIQQYTIMSMHGHRPDLFGNIRASLPARKGAGKGGK